MKDQGFFKGNKPPNSCMNLNINTNDQINRVRYLCSAMVLACEGIQAAYGADPLTRGLLELASTLSSEAEKLADP